MILLHWIPLLLVMALRGTRWYGIYAPYECMPRGFCVGQFEGPTDFLCCPLPIYEFGRLPSWDCMGWLQMHLLWDSRRGFCIEWIDCEL